MVKAQVTITAFGETKTLRGWAADPRCRVGWGTLRSRVIQHGREPEASITTPPDPKQARAGRRSRATARRYTAWGESRSVRDWVADPRCVVTARVLRDRVTRGGDVEQALTTPPGNRNTTRYEAWGESRTIAEWVADPRCQVDRARLLVRFYRRKYPNEVAISTPYTPRRRCDTAQYTAWGESKTAEQWAADPRCRVGHNAIWERVRYRGYTHEAAISTPRQPAGKKPRQ